MSHPVLPGHNYWNVKSVYPISYVFAKCNGEI